MIAVNGDHPASRRFGQLNRQHPDQSGADDRYDLTQHRLALTESLQRDGPDRAQRGRLQRNRLRNPDGKIFGNEIDFAMAGIARAGASHAIAGLKFRARPGPPQSQFRRSYSPGEPACPAVIALAGTPL